MRGVGGSGNGTGCVEVAWLDDTIHDVPLQKPHLVADQIKRFLKERV
jgi:hypothetical protein